ncbi:MAG TPA: hypothetical protein VF755_28855 [Catenuloplanes sp.]|jgi:hypothetical protein
MHDSGGGGGYGGSNWSAANVRQLWELVKEQETEAHWKLVAGWRRSAELTAAHLARVQNYRNNLATAWPPEKSPAAAAYLARLDEMISNLRETNEAAVANYTTFATTTGALSTSRSELKKLYDEYVANEDRIQQYEKAKAAALLSPTPSPTPSPSPGPTALPSRPPVTPDQQEQLNWKARSVMYELSGTLVEARAQIKLPTPYKPPKAGIEEATPKTGDGTSPPPIPPIMVAPDSTRSTQLPSRRPVSGTGGSAGTRTLDPGPRVPGSNGPTLVGTPPVITPPTLPMPPGLPGPGPGTPINTGIIGGPPPLTPPSILPPGIDSRLGNPPSGTLPPTRIGTDGTSGGVGKSGTGGSAGGVVRPMPPGGVIGQPPAMGLGQPAGGRPPAQRVNPVGGVIGAPQQAGGWGSAAGRGQQSGPAGASHGRGRSAKYHRSEEHWRTDEGVPPVVSPPREPGRLDPGPAIGLDR